MAIKGSLREASLPDVLQLLAMGQKTGCLSIADRSNFGYIYFDKGRICYASIVNRRDRLGDILVKHGKITQEHLDAGIHRQAKERGKKLGQILVLQEVITQEDLERYMRVQIEESVFYLFTWTQGTFNFEADVRPEQQDFLVSINPESLLLEGARRVDEWSLVEKKIPAFDLIWNALQTFVRVPVAGLLAYGATAQLSPGAQLASAVLASGIAFASHGGKTAIRAAITPSPEPLTNIGLSLTEDALAIGLVWFATRHPYAAAVIVAILLVCLIFVVRMIAKSLRVLFRGARAQWHKLQEGDSTASD